MISKILNLIGNYPFDDPYIPESSSFVFEGSSNG